MHLRQWKTNIGLRVAIELHQPVDNWFVFEVSKAPIHEFALCFYPGIFIQVVIYAKVILVK